VTCSSHVRPAVIGTIVSGTIVSGTAVFGTAVVGRVGSIMANCCSWTARITIGSRGVAARLC